MSAAREEILREADMWAVRLRRAGFTEVEVAHHYCIGNDISGGMFTRTVCLYVGPRVPPEKRRGFLSRVKSWWQA